MCIRDSARTDRERVVPLVDALEAQGWSVWWDPNIAFACDLVVHLHDPDAAIEMLRPVFASMSRGFLGHARVDPDLEPLRADPPGSGAAPAAT